MTEFKKPDLKAPRFRSDRPGILNHTFYPAFRKKFPKYASATNSEIRNVVREYNTQLWNGVIEYRDGVELPQGLGNMFIGTCNKPKIRYNSNFGESIKNNVLTRIKNYESDGYLAKIFYTNYASKYLFAFREFWEFKGYKDFTNGVSKSYPENWKKYIMIENGRLISKLYKKASKKIFAMDQPKIIAADYNEFNLD